MPETVPPAVLSSLAPLHALPQAPATQVVRDFYVSPEHTFDPRLLRECASRAELSFLDSLVHGQTVDPMLNWSALAKTPPGREPHAHRLTWYEAWAGVAARRAEWRRAHGTITSGPDLPAGTDLTGVAALGHDAFAQRLNLPPLPRAPDTADGRRADLVWRRALLLLLAKRTPASLSDVQPPLVPFLYRTQPDRAEEWFRALDTAGHGDRVPLICVEPFDFWASVDLSAWRERPVVFAFSSHNALWHALVSDALFESLLLPGHAVLVGGEYPDEHVFSAEAVACTGLPPVQVAGPTHAAWRSRGPAMLEALGHVLHRLRRGEPARNPHAQGLFELGLNLKHEILRSRYGVDRACTLHRMYGTERWFSPFKDPPPPGFDTHPPRDLLAIATGPSASRPARRALAGRARRKLVHVVSQVVDGGHAPSTLVRTLVERADRSRWDISVISLETAVLRAAEYPRSSHATDASSGRGARTIRTWAETDVAFHACGVEGTGDDAIAEACARMTDWSADVAVWHGNDPSLLVCAARCDVPRRVFFEHSGLVFQSDFDLVIGSLADAPERFAAESSRSGIPVAALPYCSNARSTWEENPPDLRMGPDIRILTTISNHLENRVAGVFVEAVATILQICPRAVYAPIGPIHDVEAFRGRFAPWGVSHRVMCVGAHRAPSQLCRAMHLYLNEFPFGSGIAILDAMAAGLPVVTMYDPNGPMQAQNGANYIGVDRSVRSLDPVDYVTLACQLLQDAEMYREWSAHALARFEAFGPEPYVRRFEEILTKRLLSPGGAPRSPG